MSKPRATIEEMKRAGLVQGPDGNYVPVKSLVAKGKVSKLPDVIERADIDLSTGKLFSDLHVASMSDDEFNRRLKDGTLTKILRAKEKSKLKPLNVKQVHSFSEDKKDGVGIPSSIITGKQSDMIMATGFAMMADAYQKEPAIHENISFKNKDGITEYLGRIPHPELLEELLKVSNFYGTKIMSEWTKVNIKPLTQNRAWKGRRFKSDQYKAYAIAVSLLLPANLIVPDGLLKVYYEFGISTNSDFDNPCKMFTDILQSKYHFNDSKIMEAHIKKVIVKKGEEFIKFRIESL